MQRESPLLDAERQTIDMSQIPCSPTSPHEQRRATARNFRWPSPLQAWARMTRIISWVVDDMATADEGLAPRRLCREKRLIQALWRIRLHLQESQSWPGARSRADAVLRSATAERVGKDATGLWEIDNW